MAPAGGESDAEPATQDGGEAAPANDRLLLDRAGVTTEGTAGSGAENPPALPAGPRAGATDGSDAAGAAVFPGAGSGPPAVPAGPAGAALAAGSALEPATATATGTATGTEVDTVGTGGDAVGDLQQPAGPQRLAELEAKIARARRRSRSDATLRAYRSDWADFARWCAASGLVALPARPATVAAYVAELAEPAPGRPARRPSTIERRLSALGEAQRAAGVVPNPVADPLVRETMAGARRMLGVAPTRKRGVSTEDVRAAVGAMGDRLIDVRDRALLLVGFAGGYRRSALVAHDVTDIEDHPAGLLFHLRRSKTDQEGAGQRIEVAYGQGPATCPVRATRRWLAAAGITTGPWMRPVDRHGNVGATRLTGRAVARVVKRHMAPLGYPEADFAGHSLRRGMATTARRNGASTEAVMATTGHTSRATLDIYVEDAKVFTDPASSYLGL